MRVLVACEYSGITRDAFRARGHEAWSCDILPTETNPRWHMQGDAKEAVTRFDWDLIIAHPPCTYLSNSGAKHLYKGMKQENGICADRWKKMEEAAAFFRFFLDHPCDHMAIENPIMHGHAQAIVGRPPFQIIHPWEHGHGETKATCLWLKGLMPIRPTNIVDGREARIHRMSRGPQRSHLRSLTYTGIAAAMAEQWG